MPEPDISSAPQSLDSGLDRQLLAAILLCPLAVGVNTIVGFTVAHWVCDVNRKTDGFLVSLVDLALCMIAAALAYRSYRRLHTGDDSGPEQGRRRFMAKIGLALAAFSTVVVIAGTLVMVTLSPCD